MAIERTFVDGKMVVTFPNGRSREITVEQLQQRKANVPTMFANRTARINQMIARVTERIANETDETKKNRMQARLTKMQERQSNLPTQENIEARLDGWIAQAQASVGE
jgi:uncharacterized circularly permuted ATP-grasp superfamily protein